MYKQSVPLGSGAQLQFDWGKNYRDFAVYRNGQLLGSIPDKASLKLGQSFQLPDQGQVTVILSGQGLEAWHNGVDLLSGLPSGFVDHFKNAANYLIGYGILQWIIGGALAMVSGGEPRAEALPVLLGVLAVGAVLIGLGLWARQSGSPTPLIIAMVLLSLGIVLTLLSGQIAGVVITGVILYQLYKGIRAGAVVKRGVVEREGPLDAGM